MKRSHSSDLSGAAKLVPFCPVCEAKYGSASATTLGKDGETQVFHYTCRSCAMGVLAVVHQGDTGESSVGMVTDLNVEDVQRFRRSRRVQTDDVIETHRFFSGIEWVQAFRPRTVRRTRVKTPAKTTAKRRPSALS
jgi:hypothetical protein